jgi:putative transposase
LAFHWLTLPGSGSWRRFRPRGDIRARGPRRVARKSLDLSVPLAPARAGPPEARVKEICATRVPYGVRHVHARLRREGWEVNHKKTHRVYRESGPQLRNKTPKRRVKAKLREDRRNPAAANEPRAIDFVHDQLAAGRKLRVLTIVDAFSRFCPAVDPRFSYRGEDVVKTLEAVCAEVGHPKTIRVDNGGEFISRDLDL